jgi:2-oxoisovalerate dehydrogenase E1 component
MKRQAMSTHQGLRAFSAGPTVATRMGMYRSMLRIRRIEETIAARYAEQEMRCPVHLSIGQEAAAVGACAALERDDKIVTTHRCHAHYLAKGGNLEAMIAELYGRTSGTCGGRGGSMHLFDDRAGVVASVPIVGSSVPLGAGVALAQKQQRNHGITVSFFGDGALEEGAVHEAMNLAALLKLPMVFFLENNLYSVYTHLSDRQPNRSLADAAKAHGMRSYHVDGTDVEAVYEATRDAATRARSGVGPSLIVADTYRFVEHCGPADDDGLGYRPRGELAGWKERCPLTGYGVTLRRDALLDDRLDAQLATEVDSEIASAFERALAAASPDPATVGDHVFYVPPVRGVPMVDPNEPSSVISAAEGIREATEHLLATDPRVFVVGEGVNDPKGIFGTTSGLAKRFGENRVIEMPIAENGFTGMAIGAALAGQRPLVIHQRVEFCLLALEQLANNAAKMHYVSNGRHRVPLVVRLISGRGWGQGPAHSQTLENLFALIPGLKVVMPSTAADAKGLLLGAMDDGNPVIFLEHRWIHYATGSVPNRAIPLPLDGPRKVREGKAATVVASSYMTLEAIQAADALARYDASIDLFDLRVISPLDLGAIEESVRETGRLLVVDTGFAHLGLGAEIVARVAESCHGWLKAPPRRMGLAHHPTPSARDLAGAYYKTSVDIARMVADLAGLTNAARAELTSELEAVRNVLPPDVPNPTFRGPF